MWNVSLQRTCTVTSRIPFLRQRAQLRGGTPRLPLGLSGEEGRRGRPGRCLAGRARTSGLSCVGAAWGLSDVSAPTRRTCPLTGQLCSGPARGRLGPWVGRLLLPDTREGLRTPFSPARRGSAPRARANCGETQRACRLWGVAGQRGRVCPCQGCGATASRQGL